MTSAFSWLLSEYYYKKLQLSFITAFALATIFIVSIGFAFSILVIAECGIERYKYWGRGVDIDAMPVIAVGLFIAIVAYQLRFQNWASLLIFIGLLPSVIFPGIFFVQALLYGATPGGTYILGIKVIDFDYKIITVTYSFILIILTIIILNKHYKKLHTYKKLLIITVATLLAYKASYALLATGVVIQFSLTSLFDIHRLLI